ncbi:hypothetical protein FZEAL_8051 [Fusarium zealandicum]|uniref:Arrestin C-terminal-like domain-containing protein n=1 Tax=Fusarium zealandicum TaxID=1053134 RepID=A0A8H4XH68_9HYPO|nr:hypothetical protein FZEAL_8051 [Fusarium zealandicum]
MWSFLAKLTGTPRARVTIKPDCDYLFLSGQGEEAHGQYIRGKVLLALSGDEAVQGVQLKLTGHFWMGDHDADTDEAAGWKSTDFLVHEWGLFKVPGSYKQQHGGTRNYEWPFEHFINGNQQESMRGCDRCRITYRLEASTISEGPSNDFRDFVPIRIIRCPPLSDFELLDPITLQGKWLGRVEYSVSLRHQATALGGLIPIEAKIANVGAGLRLTSAKFYLRETHTVHDKHLADLFSYQGQRTVTEWPLLLCDKGRQGQTWQQCLHLPRIVRKCSPDFNVRGITISHSLHFAATLRESDGTESEYEDSMPIIVFISPELPINGWGVFAQEHEKRTDEAVIKRALSEGVRVPPKYMEVEDSINDYETPPPPYTTA